MDIFTHLVIVFIIILLSMTFHEAMHAFTSYWLGDDTARLQGRLTLNPIAHIDPFMTILLPLLLALTGAPIFGGAKPVQFDPSRVRYGDFGAALVGAAGPLTNLILAFIAFGALALLGVDGLIGTCLQLVVYINLGFFIFNLIPIPPLDGSRILYAVAPEPARRVMEAIEQHGLIIIFAAVLLLGPFISTFMLSATSFFLNAFSLIFGVKMI